MRQFRASLQPSDRQNPNGFTVVELLIVIVVIAILAVVTIVTYKGIRERTANTAILSEFTSWQEVFGTYFTMY